MHIIILKWFNSYFLNFIGNSSNKCKLTLASDELELELKELLFVLDWKKMIKKFKNLSSEEMF